MLKTLLSDGDRDLSTNEMIFAGHEQVKEVVELEIQQYKQFSR